MMHKYRDMVSGGALLFLGAVMFATSFGIPRGAEMGVGAGFMPRLMSVLLAVSGLALMLQGRGTAAAAAPEKGGANYQAVVLSLVYLGLFVVFLNKAGFVIATCAYLFLQTVLFCPANRRNYKTIAILSVVATACIYLVFAKGFKLLLPAGILG